MRHSRIQATAYHEAGHAAAAIKLGIGLGRKGVSIKPDADSFGYADIFKGFSGNPKYGHSDAQRMKMEKRVIVCLAGAAAQREFLPGSVRSWHGSADRKNAIDLIFLLSGSEEEANAYFAWLNIRAKNLVASPAVRGMIEGIAEALIKRKWLSPSEVTTIAHDARKRAVSRVSSIE